MSARIGALLGTLHGKVLLFAVLTACVVIAPEPSPPPVGAVPGLDRRPHWFAISGDAAQVLHPGGVAPLNLRLGNVNRAAVVLSDLLVTVSGIHAPYADAMHPCTVADFDVQPLRTEEVVTLPGRSLRSLRTLGVPQAEWPAVSMIDRAVNQDGCKGSTIELAYTGIGTPVAS